MTIRNVSKSIYQRTRIEPKISGVATLFFATQQSYIEWLKANPTAMVHSVDETDEGLFLKYTK